MDEDAIEEQIVLNTLVCCLVHSLTTHSFNSYLLNIVCQS